MANPFRAKFDSHCQECGEFIPQDELMYRTEDELFVCEECAKDKGNVCKCGNFKKQAFELCYECFNQLEKPEWDPNTPL